MRPPRRTVRTLSAAVTVALLAAAVADAAPRAHSAPSGQAYRFVSNPALHPPKIRFTFKRGHRSPGSYLVGVFRNFALPQPMVGQGGPLILDGSGQPVWFHPITPKQYSLNLQAQTYRGAPVLTWWQGTLSRLGQPLTGRYYLVDNHYRTIRTFTGVNGWVLSMHDFVITPAGTALVTAYKPIKMNLKKYGGPANGRLLDTAVLEFDLATGKLVYQWDALKHIPLSQTRQRPVGRDIWDPYHLNSANEPSTGHLLISVRNTWAIYQINRATGAIELTLGGKGSTFAFARNARFAWQHDAHLLGGNEVGLFDDECCGISPKGKGQPAVYGPSRGLILKLDMTGKRVTLVRQYRHGRLVAGTQGNMQVEPDGNVIVGWGQQPLFSEYTASGRMVVDARWPNPDSSYRAFKLPWTGLPLTRPDIAVRRSKGRAVVYASWNGATQVVTWQVLAGPSTGKLKLAGHSRRRGFETAIAVKGSARVYELRALDAAGHVIGTSKAVRR